jgi:hypothetical protein
MTQTVQLSERIRGRYEHVPPILRLEFHRVVREPLDELRVQVGGGSIGRRIHAHVGPMEISPPTPDVASRILTVPLSWQAAEHPALFPTMNGQLVIRPAGDDAIELDLTGEYTPPLGAIGAIGDRLAGHEAATASLRSYLHEIARRLTAELAAHPPPSPFPPLSEHPTA